MSNDVGYMEEALSEAHEAEAEGEVPVGAVVVCEGEIIARAHNRSISDCDPTAHAEILALRAAARVQKNYRLRECDLYVTLEPCAMCVGALVHARVRRLVYAAADPKAGAVVCAVRLLEAAHFNHRVEVTSGVLAEESAALLQRFFALRREAEKAAGSGES